MNSSCKNNSYTTGITCVFDFINLRKLKDFEQRKIFWLAPVHNFCQDRQTSQNLTELMYSAQITALFTFSFYCMHSSNCSITLPRTLKIQKWSVHILFFSAAGKSLNRPFPDPGTRRNLFISHPNPKCFAAQHFVSQVRRYESALGWKASPIGTGGGWSFSKLANRLFES